MARSACVGGKNYSIDWDSESMILCQGVNFGFTPVRKP